MRALRCIGERKPILVALRRVNRDPKCSGAFLAPQVTWTLRRTAFCAMLQSWLWL